MQITLRFFSFLAPRPVCRSEMGGAGSQDAASTASGRWTQASRRVSRFGSKTFKLTTSQMLPDDSHALDWAAEDTDGTSLEALIEAATAGEDDIETVAPRPEAIPLAQRTMLHSVETSKLVAAQEPPVAHRVIMFHLLFIATFLVAILFLGLMIGGELKLRGIPS